MVYDVGVRVQVQGAGFGYQYSWVLGLRVQGSGVRVEDLGSRV